jgi:low affinity Fe/Cu permease
MNQVNARNEIIREWRSLPKELRQRNTISSIVTFMMVFLIQNAQNRDTTALQLKLDELIRATEAKNKLIGIERLSEPELESVREKIEKDENSHDSNSARHEKQELKAKC